MARRRGAGRGRAPRADGRRQDPGRKILASLFESALARKFLIATGDLPPASARTIYRDEETRAYFSAAAAAAMPETRRAELTEQTLAAETFYYTKYGTPLAFGRALDVVGETGVFRFEGLRVLDFGYGTIGQLRLMALRGADAVGVDVDSFLTALYSDPADQGLLVPPGRVTLVDGAWPGDAETRTKVGDGYDLIVSKNTLKRGYIHPEREVNPRMLVHLGVDDETFVRAVHESLVPGGLFLIYNLSPAPSKPDEPYKPWADGRCPFDRAVLESAGFEIVAYDTDDSAFVRKMGSALGWDKGERGMDLENELFATYTLLRKTAE